MATICKACGLDGQQYEVGWDEANLSNEVNYISLRQRFAEEQALMIVSRIKQVTGRKLAIVFGNCQTIWVRNLLRIHKIVQREYLFMYLPAVCDYHESFVDQLHEGFWHLCDLFIAQRVKADNAFGPKVGTMQFLAYLPETAKVIWIPNLYYIGYWPQFCKNERNVDTHIHSAGRFMNGDRYIDAYMLAHDGVKLSEVREYIRKQSFIDEQETKSLAAKSLMSLKEHEWTCDIRMADAVEECLWELQLFYAANHPAMVLLEELVRRILEFMGIKLAVYTSYQLFDQKLLIGQDIPIYPRAAEILGLKEQLQTYYANTCLWTYQGDWLEFGVEYVKWIWRDRLKE